MKFILACFKILKEQQKVILSHVFGSGVPTKITDITDLGLSLSSIQELSILDRMRLFHERSNY